MLQNRLNNLIVIYTANITPTKKITPRALAWVEVDLRSHNLISGIWGIFNISYNFILIMPVMSRFKLVILQLRRNSNKAFSKLNNLDAAINHFF